MLWKLFITDLKMLARNRQSLFWAFMFPLMFTVIFGFFFGKNSNIGTIALIDQSNNTVAQTLSTTLENSGLYKVNKETDIGQAKDEIRKSTISAAILIPQNFGNVDAPQADNTIQIIFDKGNAQVGSTLDAFVNSYLTNLNLQIQNAKPIFTSSVQYTNDRELSYFDFVLAGLIGLALMNSSIIGVAVSMSKYREDQILKRITTTPLKVWEFIAAEVLSRLVLNVVQVGLILAVGVYLFSGHIYGNIPLIFLLAILGAILFQLMGFVISSFSKTTDAAQGMTTAITVPMMFLAGVFFPIDALPKWLFSIVQFLPLAPLLRMIRSVALDAVSPLDNPINLYIVIGWIIVTLAVAIWRFRLSEE